MVFMTVFLMLGIGKYLSDFGTNALIFFLPKDSIFINLMSAVGQFTNSFIDVILRTFVLSVPIVGGVIDMIYGYLESFLYICENIENVIGKRENPTNTEYEKLEKIIRGIKETPKIAMESMKCSVGIPRCGSITERTKTNSKINEFADSVLLYLSASENKKNNIKSFIFGGLVVTMYKLLTMIQLLKKYMGGSVNILSTVKRGFIAGSISFIVLLVILIMVIFFPTAFGG
jgi:hypothetical protein